MLCIHRCEKPQMSLFMLSFLLVSMFSRAFIGWSTKSVSGEEYAVLGGRIAVSGDAMRRNIVICFSCNFSDEVCVDLCSHITLSLA